MMIMPPLYFIDSTMKDGESVDFVVGDEEDLNKGSNESKKVFTDFYDGKDSKRSCSGKNDSNYSSNSSKSDYSHSDNNGVTVLGMENMNYSHFPRHFPLIETSKRVQSDTCSIRNISNLKTYNEHSKSPVISVFSPSQSSLATTATHLEHNNNNSSSNSFDDPESLFNPWEQRYFSDFLNNLIMDCDPLMEAAASVTPEIISIKGFESSSSAKVARVDLKKDDKAPNFSTNSNSNNLTTFNSTSSIWPPSPANSLLEESMTASSKVHSFDESLLKMLVSSDENCNYPGKKRKISENHDIAISSLDNNTCLNEDFQNDTLNNLLINNPSNYQIPCTKTKITTSSSATTTTTKNNVPCNRYRNHIASEQKRRLSIRATFEELAQLIPMPDNIHKSKCKVLFSTVSYVKWLQEKSLYLRDLYQSSSQSYGINVPNQE